MTEVLNEEISLIEFASNHKIYDLSSEDIIKLINKPYLIEEITEAFHITKKEFDEIRKEKGITNIILEDTIRDIEVILNELDSNDFYISNTVFKKIIDDILPILLTGTPKKKYYIDEIKKINFTRDIFISDLYLKGIDTKYRLKHLKDILVYTKKKVKELVKEEKEYFLEDNHQKLYKELLHKKKEGKIFNKSDLTYDILFELAIIENITDSTIGDIYNLSKSQIKYIRNKMGIENKFKIKVQNFPEAILYSMEKNNQRDDKISNYTYEQQLNESIQHKYNAKQESENSKYQIEINNNGEKNIYNVEFSDEAYNIEKNNTKKQSHGTHRDYQKENETKRLHGKTGEKIALKAEQKRLESIGLKDLINDVKLVAQVNENITFDGVGYDLISFNELREKICIEVKTSYSKKDRPFFISSSEIELMQGLKKEHDCKECLIYYLLIDDHNVKIKSIKPYDFSKIKLKPILFQVEETL